jgi:hypothetical protein
MGWMQFIMKFASRSTPPAEASANNVREFLAELSAIAPPAGRGDYIFTQAEGNHGFVQFITDSRRQVTIHRIWCKVNGRGLGTFMMQSLCSLADNHGVTMKLKPLPIGRKPYPLSRKQLWAWYQRFGFEGTIRKMMRQPRPSGRQHDNSQLTSGDAREQHATDHPRGFSTV